MIWMQINIQYWGQLKTSWCLRYCAQGCSPLPSDVPTSASHSLVWKGEWNSWGWRNREQRCSSPPLYATLPYPLPFPIQGRARLDFLFFLSKRQTELGTSCQSAAPTSLMDGLAPSALSILTCNDFHTYQAEIISILWSFLKEMPQTEQQQTLTQKPKAAP